MHTCYYHLSHKLSFSIHLSLKYISRIRFYLNLQTERVYTSIWTNTSSREGKRVFSFSLLNFTCHVCLFLHFIFTIYGQVHILMSRLGDSKQTIEIFLYHFTIILHASCCRMHFCNNKILLSVPTAFSSSSIKSCMHKCMSLTFFVILRLLGLGRMISSSVDTAAFSYLHYCSVVCCLVHLKWIDNCIMPALLFHIIMPEAGKVVQFNFTKKTLLSDEYDTKTT